MRRSGIGNKKEDFDVFEILGRGGFAKVYRARSKLTGQEVAIKIIDKKIAQESKMTDRVRKEVELHYRLKHPAILELYSFFEDAHYVYFVLELCHNGDLYRKLQEQGPFSEDSARCYMKQILSGVKYLHQYNILHRDLTLANILLTREDRVKICDFGLATELGGDGDGAAHFTMCGTPNYISPEVVGRARQGLEADVWSVGCILYTLLVGRAPFDTKEVRATLSRVQAGSFELPPGLSSIAQQLISGVLQTSPSRRLTLTQVCGHEFMRNRPRLKDYSSTSRHHAAKELSGTDSGIVSMNSQPSSRRCPQDKTGSLLLCRETGSSVTSQVGGRRTASCCVHAVCEHATAAVKPTTSPSTPVTPTLTPLDSRRLRPLRQVTRTAVLNILDDHSVCVEFIRGHKVSEVLCVDPSGDSMLLYSPSDQITLGIEFTGPSPPRPGDQMAHYSLAVGLPDTVASKYRVAKKFVDVVRSNTAKLTVLGRLGKCVLMEGGDCELTLYEGVTSAATVNRESKVDKEDIVMSSLDCISNQDVVEKLRLTAVTKRITVTFKGGTYLCLESLDGNGAVSPSLVRWLNYFRQNREHCEGVLAALESSDGRLDHSMFPAVLGRRPSKLLPTTNDTSCSNRDSRDCGPVFVPGIGCWATKSVRPDCLVVQFGDGSQLRLTYQDSSSTTMDWRQHYSRPGHIYTAIDPLPPDLNHKLSLLPHILTALRLHGATR